MNWFEFLVSTFIFLTFFIFVFIFFTNRFSSNLNEIKESEMPKAIQYISSILLSKGIPEDWEKRNDKPISAGVMDKIYFLPIIVNGENNNRSKEIVSLKLELDEDCRKRISNESFIIFDGNLNEVNFTSFDKNYCQNGWVKNVSIVFFDYFNSTKKYYFYYSSQDLNKKNYTVYSDLLAYWNFDEENVAEDKTQYKNHGIAFNPVIVKGFFGKALNFTEGSFVNISSNNLNASKISIDLWINISSPTDSIIIEKYNSYGIRLESGKVLGYVYGLPTSLQPSSAELQQNRWYHITFVSDGIYHKLYIDGVLFNSTNYEAAIPTQESPLSIGADYSGNNNFHGVIDEIRIYNYTLSDFDILASNSSQPLMVKVLPEVEEDVISFEKIEAMKNITSEDLARIFGNYHKFRVEVYKK
jgi:hypothetical protein